MEETKKCLFCKKEIDVSKYETKKFCSTNCRVKAYQRRKRNSPSMKCFICKEGNLTYKIIVNKPPRIMCTNCRTTWKVIE